MRFVAFAFACCALFLTGCPPTVQKCADGTLFIALELGNDVANADTLLIDIKVGSDAAIQRTLDHTPGKRTGGIQIEFPNGYPAGQLVRVTVTARFASNPVASNFVEVTFDGKCESAMLTVGQGVVPDLTSVTTDMTAVDLVGADLTALPDLVPVVDLSGSDLVVCAATESCFDGVDNDCDQLVDCADPDCTTGGTPIAECVPDPATATPGTTTTTSCPPNYPTLTTLYSGFNPSACNVGTASCSGSDPGYCDAVRQPYSDSACTNTLIAMAPFSSKDGCKTISPINSPNYFKWQPAAWHRTNACDGVGSAAKEPASFDTNENFCAAAAMGGGCGASQVCVPRAANHCVVVNTAGTCPAGYTERTVQYYLDFADTRTCSHYCTGGAGTCPANVQLQNGCAGDGQSSFSACLPYTDVTNGYTNVIVPAPTSSGSCTTPIAQSSGTSLPTNPRRVCCIP